MTKKKKQESAESGFEGVENALGRTEQYIEENQKSLTIIVAAIIIMLQEIYRGTEGKGSQFSNVRG